VNLYISTATTTSSDTFFEEYMSNAYELKAGADETKKEEVKNEFIKLAKSFKIALKASCSAAADTTK